MTETTIRFVPEGTKGQELISVTGKEERYHAREVPWSAYRIGGSRGAFDLSANRIFAASRRSQNRLWKPYAYSKNILNEVKKHKSFQLKNTHLARQNPKVGGEYDPVWLEEAYIYLNWHVRRPNENVLLASVKGTLSLSDILQETLLIGAKLLRQITGPVVFSITGHRERDSIARISCSPTVSFEQIYAFLMTVGNLNLFNKDKIVDISGILKGGNVSDMIK